MFAPPRDGPRSSHRRYAEVVPVGERMRGVTVEPLVRHDVGQIWTVEDLEGLPDTGMRYEILEGSLLVSPVPRNRHGRVMGRVLELLRSQAPQDAFVSAFGIGIQIRGGRTYFIPDVLVVRDDGPDDDALGVD